jgi:hypothetical protein
MLSRLIPAAAAAALLLSGCAAGQQPAEPVEPAVTTAPAEPSPTPTPTSSAAPEADPEQQAEADAVLVTAESITVLADDGTLLAAFDYFQPTEQVVDGLTAAFGLTPASERFEGGEGHATPSTVWDWDGFHLNDTDYAGNPPFYPNHWVRVLENDVNGVQIETVDGVRVGDDAAAIEARYPDTSSRITAGNEPERLDVHLGAVPLPKVGENSDGNYEFSVWLIAEDPNGSISEYRTPSPNFGA